MVNDDCRNLFFRTSALIHAGILPVFVLEGKAPEVKWQTMSDRLDLRRGAQGKASAHRSKRTNLNRIFKEVSISLPDSFPVILCVANYKLGFRLPLECQLPEYCDWLAFLTVL